MNNLVNFTLDTELDLGIQIKTEDGLETEIEIKTEDGLETEIEIKTEDGLETYFPIKSEITELEDGNGLLAEREVNTLLHEEAKADSPRNTQEDAAVTGRGGGVRTRGGGRDASARGGGRGGSQETAEIPPLPNVFRGILEGFRPSSAAIVRGERLDQPLINRKKRKFIPNPAPASGHEVPKSPSPKPDQSEPPPKRASEEPRFRFLDVQADDSANEVPRPPPLNYLKDDEIEHILNYGSEPDSDDEDDNNSDEENEVSHLPQIPLPRANRWHYVDEQNEPAESSSEPDAVHPPQEIIYLAEEVPGELTYMPHSKYDFIWTTFPENPVPPRMRRETFVGNPGPKKELLTPYAAFREIWDDNIMDLIASETNAYYQQCRDIMTEKGLIKPHSRILKWKDTNKDELLVYFGILIATGLCVKSSYKDYFYNAGNVTDTPNFSKYMNFNRFVLLNRFLHFQPNSMVTASMSKGEAKLEKIRPIVKHLNEKFQSLYELDRNIVIDEGLTVWKGWLSIKQFIKNKAASTGVKSYELCESKSGYLYRFEIYGRKTSTTNIDENVPAELSGTIPTLVTRLTRGLEGKGHTLYMDNFYNSPALARDLKSKGIDCVGTLRTNRQLVPNEIKGMNKNDMKEGEIVAQTSGDVDIIAWKDKNRVVLLSTYHGNGVSSRANNNKEKPVAVLDYNVCMGGVDKKDQLLASYPMERKKCAVWYKKKFRRLLNVSILNSWILSKSHTRLTHLDHRKSLTKDIFKNHSKRFENMSEPLYTSRTYKKVATPKFAQMTVEHFSQLHDFCPAPRQKEHLRKRCVICKKLTATYCPGCNMTLCAFTCHIQHHSHQSVLSVNEE